MKSSPTARRARLLPRRGLRRHRPRRRARSPISGQGDFVHVCKGGPNKDQACTVATQDADCPRAHASCRR